MVPAEFLRLSSGRDGGSSMGEWDSSEKNMDAVGGEVELLFDNLEITFVLLFSFGPLAPRARVLRLTTLIPDADLP